MTLLIGTFSDTHIVLTADGLCVEQDPGCPPKYLCNLQKIFPVSSLPIAILHHGQNIIGGKNIKEIISNFVVQNNESINDSSLDRISQLLFNFLDVDAKQTLNELAHIDTGIGFWVTGFGFNQKFPGIYEIWWKGQDNVSSKKKDRFLLGGSAKRFIPPSMEKKYNFDIEKNNVKQQVRRHNELYEFAEKVQKKQTEIISGGYKHQLVISAAGCEWIVPPHE